MGVLALQPVLLQCPEYSEMLDQGQQVLVERDLPVVVAKLGESKQRIYGLHNRF